ncbi:hypothetical protein MUY21_11130 [Aliiroseovarius sp. S2029]|uniref:hypothetical protein n=1 Tax=Aliiroseovarius sp. S2029 TaxID=2936988 RepID=UPI0020BD8219|nr:hypothetical protein [Aliiroseovarius sp. S2029]MCK8484587.1 hypothetical protein [Aliiroseovarius sp. S2029]
MTPLRARILTICGAALILMFFSELFFVNEGPSQTVRDLLSRPAEAGLELLELTAYYAFFAWILLLLLPYAERFGLAGLLLAGCLFGWVTEGTVIPLVHEAPPVSWVWPSISWHALIDVLLGLFALRWAMRRLGLTAQCCLFAGLGLIWAIWATWTWGGPGMDRTTPGAFVFYAFASSAFWLTGLVLLDHGGCWSATKTEHWVLGAAAAVLGGAMATMALPMSAGILTIAVTTWWLLIRNAPRTPAKRWRLPSGGLVAHRYLVVVITPVTASLGYWFLWDNGWRIPTEEITALALLLGVAIYFWAIWHVFTTR